MFTKIRSILTLLILSPALLFLGGQGIKTPLTEHLHDVAGQEMTLQIRQYPEDRHSWDRSDTILVRLNRDRLRAYDFSLEDLQKALTPSGLIDSAKRVEPPLGVVFVTRVTNRPDQYENIILRANAEGEIVRLKDVATVEFVPAN